MPGIALLIHQPLKYIHSSAHTRYADVYRRETEASYSDLYSISSLSAMGFWKQNRLSVQPGFTGEKKERGGRKKKEKRKRRVHRNVGKTEIKFGAERRRKKERERREKARESGKRKIGRGEKGKEMGKT